MQKDELIALGLEDTEADKVLLAFKDHIKGFVPKHRFDELNKAKKDLETSGNVELHAEIERLKGEIEKEKETNSKTINQIKIDTAIDKALLGAKAKNTLAVKALLKLDTLTLDGDTLNGLDEQIKTLTDSEDTKFLFANHTEFKGLKPGESADNPGGLVAPKDLTEAVQSHFNK